MQNKIVISPTDKRAIAFFKSLKEKKAKIQKHFAKSGKLPTLSVQFNQESN